MVKRKNKKNRGSEVKSGLEDEKSKKPKKSEKKREKARDH